MLFVLCEDNSLECYASVFLKTYISQIEGCIDLKVTVLARLKRLYQVIISFDDPLTTGISRVFR